MNDFTPAPPTGAEKIRIGDGKLNVPDRPILPFIEGDGTGPDIWRASVRVYRRGGGEGLPRQAQDRLDGSLRRREGVQPDSTTGCPTTTVAAFRDYLVGIKGPLTTPVGGGIRSLNVALRQMLDLYVLPAPGALFQGRALAGEKARGRGHGDLPREHRGHLRRHRIRRAARRGAEDARLSAARSSPRTSPRSASAPAKRRRLAEAARERSARRSARCGGSRHRHQAGELSRHRAPGAQRHRVSPSRTSARA